MLLIVFSKVLYKIRHRIELKLKGYFQYKSHLKGRLYMGKTEFPKMDLQFQYWQIRK